MNSEPSHGLSLLWVCLSGCVQAPAAESVHNERNTCSRTSDPITSSTPPTGPTPSLLNTSQNSLRTLIRGTLIVVLLRRKRVSRYIPSCSDTEKQNFFIRTLRLAQSPGLPGPAGTFYLCWSGHACFLCRVNELRSGKKKFHFLNQHFLSSVKTQDFFFRTRTIIRRICFLFPFSNKINVFAGFLIPSRLWKEITNILVGKKFLYFSLIIIINYDVTLNVLNHIRLWNKDMTWCNTAEKTWTLNLTEWQHRLVHMNVRLDLKKREALIHLWFCRNKLLF